MAVTLTCTVGDPWAGVDGRANAPSGAAQYPSLLNSYPTASAPNARVRWPTLSGTQPQWMVVGIDYAAGPQSTPTKIVGTDALPSGAAVGTAVGGSNLINVTGNNVNLNGWDFTQQGTGSLSTGWAINVTGNNCTLQNCLIGVNPSGAQTIVPVKFASGVTGGIVQYCKLNGGGVLGANLNTGSAIQIVGPASGAAPISTFLAQYNWFYQWSGQGITLGYVDGVTVRYNLFDSAKFDDAFHANFINSASGTVNLSVPYNLFYNPAGTIPVSGGGNWPGQVNDAIQVGVDLGFGNVTGFIADSNTCVGIGVTGHRVDSGHTNEAAISCWFELQQATAGSGFQTINPRVTNNYVTQSGTVRAGTANIVLKDATVTGQIVIGNINMEDGTAANGVI